MKNTALIVSGLLYFFIMAVHILRYKDGWEVVIAQFHVPLQWSIYGAVITAILAIWMFVAAAKR